MTSTAPLYIVTFDHFVMGRRSTGTYELDMDRMTRACVMADIYAGQFDGVSRVYECVPGESCSDITEDVALELLAKACNEDYGQIPDCVVELVERNVAFSRINEATSEYRARGR